MQHPNNQSKLWKKRRPSTSWRQSLVLVALFALIKLIVLAYCESDNLLYSSDQNSRLVQNIIKSRGYIAQEHAVPATPNLKLLLVRVVNPLVREPFRPPVLFAHGILVSANSWVENSDGIEPEDWSWVPVESIPLEGLVQLLAGKAASKSLPFMMANLGFDVWLYNARETRETLLINQIDLKTLQPVQAGAITPTRSLSTMEQGRSGVDLISQITNLISPKLVPVVTQARASINEILETELTNNFNYWDYSFDDAAKIDLPAVIDYILAHNTRYKQIKYVCHSAGCAAFLMCLASKPEYGHKIDGASLFAPALNVGNLKYNLFFDVVTALEVLLVNVNMPIPNVLITQVLMDASSALCKTKGLTTEHCTRLQDNFEGETYGQNRPLHTFLNAISGRQVAHLIQALNKDRMYHFDYGNPLANKAVYGKPVPPIYDMSKVETRKLIIWTGNTDAMVMVYDTKKLADELPDSVIVDYRYVNNTGIAYNHHSFLYHINVDILTNIPTIKSLVT